ncbi:hypothetical protein B0H17DRAFT_340780 [Mycena rosella]|uniref:F-box domain-containing protein n=1 Tax=Mycena rosella TaxID=1033263 RepID=A0AAD7DRG2_MYCRO|nr:hypothetical protein B0H17DRAFT_340780 [Mycena rosella]
MLQDSPFENILHTNTVPSDADCVRIRDFLTGPRREVAYLSNEISRMDKIIQDLAHKRDVLAEFINAHLAMVSPARRLPDDIVRDIFVACLPSQRNPLIISDESPLLLCQICRAWRQLALTTPRLWASVHAVIPNQPKVLKLAEILTEWLNRSGVLPLSISVVFSKSWTGADAALPVLTRLISFSPRWQHIQFTFPNHTLFASFGVVCPRDVPMLQSMTAHGIEKRVRWVDHTDRPVDSYKFLSFLNNPSLRSVVIACGPNLDQLPLPWAHLTSLVVEEGCISCDDAIAILRQCSALEKCALMIGPLEPTTDAKTPIDLPNLRHLTISGESQGLAAPTFFRLLVLPTLCTLRHTQRSSIPDSFPFSPLLETGAAENFSLTVVELPDVALLSGCLAAMPLLQTLRLVIEARPGGWDRGAPHDSAVALLTPNLDPFDSVLCPLLKSLEFVGLDETVLDEALIHLVRARAEAASRGVAPLSHFSCEIARERQLDILPLLEREISMGLVVSIKYETPFKYLYSAKEGTERWNPAYY